MPNGWGGARAERAFYRGARGEHRAVRYQHVINAPVKSPTQKPDQAPSATQNIGSVMSHTFITHNKSGDLNALCSVAHSFKSGGPTGGRSMTRMFLGRPLEIAVFAAVLGFLIGGIAAAILYYFMM
jgi:hypothetical protein